MLKAMLGLVPDNTGVLEARASNDGALAMYEKCGFERAGSTWYYSTVRTPCMTRTPSERPVSRANSRVYSRVWMRRPRGNRRRLFPNARRRR